MMRRNDVPAFSIGLCLFGLVLLIFPSLRVAGLISLALATIYPIILKIGTQRGKN